MRLNCTNLRGKAALLREAGRAFLAGFRRPAWRDLTLEKSAQTGFEDDSHLAAVDGTSTEVEAEIWTGRLGQEKERLLSLVRGIEKEFLGTGEGLMGLAQQLNEIRKECESLTEVTMGQSQKDGAEFAFQLLKKADDLVLASYDQYDHVFTTFGELRQRLAQLSTQHDELMRVLSPLSFIMIAFRIEASRHPSEVRQAFLVLAENVNRTVTEVRDTVEQQFKKLAASERIARDLIEKVSGTNQQHREEVASTLEASRNRLDALNEAVAISGSAADALSQINQAVTRHIGRIVLAQQCQDITRQRIEHVGEAIDEMRAHLDEARSGAAESDSDMRQFVVHAAQIQLQQVQSVFDELNRAADRLTSGVENLKTEAASSKEVALTLGRSMVTGSAASQCQEGIDHVLLSLRQTVQRTADILAAFQPLQARFVDCTSGAADMATDVRHAALNAQIFAINAPDGAALEALAEQVRVISGEAIQHVEQMGTALRETIELVIDLNQRLEDFHYMSQAEQEVLAEESATSQQKLSAQKTTISNLIGCIVQQQESFAHSVGGILANVQFPATVAKASSQSIDFFQELAAWGSGEFALEAAASGKIELLKSKYTMESERDSHMAALQAVPKPAREAELDSSLELFSSIEFFDEGESQSPPAPGHLHESALQNNPSKAPTIPATPPVSAATPSEPSAEDFGDNVELF